MDVALYFMLGFGSQGHGFEQTSFLGGTWVSIHNLVFGGCGFESTTLFVGVMGLSPHLL